MPAAEWWKNHHHESDKLYLHALHLLPPCHRSTHHFDSNDRRANCRRTEEKVTKKKQLNETKHTHEIFKWMRTDGLRTEEKEMRRVNLTLHHARAVAHVSHWDVRRFRTQDLVMSVMLPESYNRGEFSASNWERSLRQKVWDFDTTLLFLQD